MKEQRNLICHIYPRRCGKWRRTVAHLLAHWDQFDGRKIIAVAIDPCTDGTDDVMRAFGDVANEIEWIPQFNNVLLQEVASFGLLMRRVEQEPGITLYCHAKGATHASRNAASHKWCDAMAAACLEYPQLVDCAMKRGNICGAFRVDSGWGFPGYHNWHFAGTWYWFRQSRAVDLGALDAQPVFYGTEAWPGVFLKTESVCLFMDGTNSHVLYQPDYWRTNITPSLKWWRKSLEKCGLRQLAGGA